MVTIGGNLTGFEPSHIVIHINTSLVTGVDGAEFEASNLTCKYSTLDVGDKQELSTLDVGDLEELQDQIVVCSYTVDI